jgi:RNA polymerase sigma-70 factor (ECF subfamily)
MNPRAPSGTYSREGEGTSAADDAALLARMSRGDQRALGTFYDRWEGAVRAMVMRVVHEHAEADDVVEEVFWQAWRQAGRFEAGRASAGTWLLTIARSRALDRLRSLRRSREDAGLDALLESGSDAEIQELPDPLEATMLAERARVVRESLATLPSDQRTALEMAYLEGLSQSEIAERTREPLGTIKTRMRLAMIKLREKLGVLREEPA